MLQPLLRGLLLCLLSMSATAALPNGDDLDAVLLRNVRDGLVDYDGIRADPAFGRFVTDLANATPSDLEERNTRLAFLINAYNGLAIQGVLDGYSPSSIFGRYRFFKRRQYGLLGETMTLKELQRSHILPLNEPRVHFAISCAALSCPRLANRAYTSEAIDSQLDAAARAFANDGTRNRYDVSRKIAFLSRIFARNRADFVHAAGSTQKYLARYVSDPATNQLLAEDGFEIRFVDDDWDLNGVYRGKQD